MLDTAEAAPEPARLFRLVPARARFAWLCICFLPYFPVCS